MCLLVQCPVGSFDCLGRRGNFFPTFIEIVALKVLTELSCLRFQIGVLPSLLNDRPHLPKGSPRSVEDLELFIRGSLSNFPDSVLSLLDAFFFLSYDYYYVVD